MSGLLRCGKAGKASQGGSGYGGARMKSQQTENSIQRGIVTFLRLTLKDAKVFAIPNRAPRTASGLAFNGCPGLLPGVPDLEIVAPGGRCYFLEVKTSKGKTSSNQDAFLTWCALKAVPYAVVRNIDEVRVALRAWNLETREAA